MDILNGYSNLWKTISSPQTTKQEKQWALGVLSGINVAASAVLGVISWGVSGFARSAYLGWIHGYNSSMYSQLLVDPAYQSPALDEMFLDTWWCIALDPSKATVLRDLAESGPVQSIPQEYAENILRSCAALAEGPYEWAKLIGFGVFTLAAVGLIVAQAYTTSNSNGNDTTYSK